MLKRVVKKVLSKRIVKDLSFTGTIFTIAIVLSVWLGLSIRYIIPTAVVPAFLSLLLTEQRWVRRWVVNVFRATRILMAQDDNPENFIEPYVKDGDLFPDVYKGTDSVDYIQIMLSWKNRIFKKLVIENIRGAIRIEKSYPPDDLPYIGSIHMEPLQEPSKTPQGIPIKITGDALKIVKDIRKKGHGKANISLKLSANISGGTVHYNIEDKIYYVG